MSDIYTEVFGKTMEQVYQNGIVTGLEKDYRCSVCGREYVRLSAAKKHFERRDCHDYRSLFKGSRFEQEMERLLIDMKRRLLIATEFRTNSHMGIHTIHTTGEYDLLAKYTAFCIKHMRNSHNRSMYSRFLLHELVPDYSLSPMSIRKEVHQHINTVLKVGGKGTYLYKFRDYALQRPEPPQYYSAFIHTYQTDLSDDDEFLLCSLERVDLPLELARAVFHLDSRIERLSDTQKMRLEHLMDRIDMLTRL